MPFSSLLVSSRLVSTNRSVAGPQVSWGAATCGQQDRPGVYARVSWFKEWINSFIAASIKENTTAY